MFTWTSRYLDTGLHAHTRVCVRASTKEQGRIDERDGGKERAMDGWMHMLMDEGESERASKHARETHSLTHTHARAHTHT